MNVDFIYGRMDIQCSSIQHNDVEPEVFEVKSWHARSWSVPCQQRHAVSAATTFILIYIFRALSHVIEYLQTKISQTSNVSISCLMYKFSSSLTIHNIRAQHEHRLVVLEINQVNFRFQLLFKNTSIPGNFETLQNLYKTRDQFSTHFSMFLITVIHALC